MRRAEHVVLINPPSPWLIRDRDIPSLGLLSLAASLREAGVSVEVCDLAGTKLEDASIPRGDLYGIGFTTPQYGLAKRLVETLSCQDAHIVLGGPHVSALPIETRYAFPYTTVLAGEADWSLVDYVLGRPVHLIPGAVYWDVDSDSLKVNPLPRVQVDALPVPARELIDIDDYHRVDTFTYLGGSYEGHVQTGRGCPYSCAFCGQRCITGGIVRLRTAEQVVSEVRMLKYRYGCDQIEFLDDTFNLSWPRVRELCKALKPLNLAWHCLLRADRATPLMMRTMAEAGCRGVMFGFESGSNEMLRRMNKKLTVDVSLRAAEVASRVGMHVRAQMIVGFPGETDETIEETAHFVRNADVAKYSFHVFSPLPGSSVWDDPAAFGLELDKENVDFEHGFTTIGKPDTWDDSVPLSTKDWLRYLNKVAAGRNIYEGMHDV